MARTSDLLSLPCAHEINLIALLDKIAPNSGGANGYLPFTCDECNGSFVLSLRSRKIEIGNFYSAGSSHFEATISKMLPRLKVTVLEPDDLEVTFGDRQWSFHNRHLTNERVAILPNSFFKNRQLQELDLAQFEVTLVGFKRNGEPLLFDTNTLLLERDQLTIRGFDRALSRAVNYLNFGPKKP